MTPLIEKNKNTYPNYLVYPAGDDIYNKNKKEDLANNKEPVTMPGKQNEKDLNEDEPGNGLDVPGAELDDEQEKIGSEDEENNYYSLGGDDHNYLDEDKGN